MGEEKWEIIENSVDNYKELPEDKKMFILGYMQGVLCNHMVFDKDSQARQLQEA